MRVLNILAKRILGFRYDRHIVERCNVFENNRPKVQKGNRMKEIIAYISLCILFISPWIYHLIYCFKNHEYVLLIAGAVIPPVGWIHGLGAFFNWW